MTQQDIDILMSVLRPRPAANGYIYMVGLEHRLIMALHVGRPLTSKESVHHIDGNPHNNAIENLQLMDRLEHTNLHNSLVKWVTSDKNRTQHHIRWRHDLTKEVLLESFGRLKSLRQMAIDLKADRKTLERRLAYYGLRVVRQRATKGYGWDNRLAEHITKAQQTAPETASETPVELDATAKA